MSKLLITILLSVAISADFFGQAITVNGVSLFESGGASLTTGLMVRLLFDERPWDGNHIGTHNALYLVY